MIYEEGQPDNIVTDIENMVRSYVEKAAGGADSADLVCPARRSTLVLSNAISVYEPKNPTQVIFTDKAQDAAAIFIAFRGTEPFDACDWSTDIDFSWYELPGVGRVHLGFLESLGLVDHNTMNTFERMKLNVAKGDGLTSGLFENMPEGPNAPIIAYDEASKVAKELLARNKNAKLYITGHSLGGALATVFTTMLFYKKEDMVTERVAAVFTFGQPRVGDEDYANYMNGKLNFPNNRYFRVVYCNDVVARVPYDNSLFQFKHFGLCFSLTVGIMKSTQRFSP